MTRVSAGFSTAVAPRVVAWTIWSLITLWGGWFFFDNWLPSMRCGDPCMRDFIDRSPLRYVSFTAAFVLACVGVASADHPRRALMCSGAALLAFLGLLATFGDVFPGEAELPFDLE